jgi:CDP-diacylglycerol--glycerol-3-phosphate 3-phosphatidyltransferase
MTLPNLISLVRVALVPVIMALILADFSNHERWAAVAYCVAAASDSLDGYLARSRGWVTVAGAFLDPLADKLLVTGAMLALVEVGRLSAWAAMAIVAREFAVSGLRMIAATGREVIAASWTGKLKTLSQNLAVVALLVVDDHRLAVDALVILAIVLSWWSLVGYAARARRHFGTRTVAS